MTKQDYTSFIDIQAKNAMEEIEKKGFISGGTNGPYNDSETPIRVSSHWIFIFSWLYKTTKNDLYKDYVKKLADYVYSQKIEISENQFQFCSRNKENKDHINGTIGGAWAIEGLVEASNLLRDNKYYDLAVKVFLSHPFNKKSCCWNRIEINKKNLGYDITFNHQLWLAAAGAQIVKYKLNTEINDQVEAFLNGLLNKNVFRIHNNGLIKHFSYIKNGSKFQAIKFFKNHILKDYYFKHSLKYKEEGYHYFALYGFAILKDTYPSHPIFTSKKFKKALNYALKQENYLRQLNRKPEDDGTGLAINYKTNLNIYCFPYNSPAFELPYIFKKLKPELYNSNFISDMWLLQKRETIDEKNNFNDNVYDKKTLTARIYELIRE